MFVVFEGLDRAGKSTQLRHLEAFLRSRSIPFETFKYPDRVGTETGSLINSFLKGVTELNWTAASYLLASNLYELAPRIESAWNAGKWILFDRYTYSSTAYSIARGLDPTVAASLCARMPEPDLVVFLAVHEDVAKERSEFGQEIFENAYFQKRVREAFELLQKPAGWRHIDVDGLCETDVHDKIVKMLST